MNTQKHCTKCGKELLPNNKFCVSCGAEIKSPKENFNDKNKTDNKDNGYNRLITAIALIVVFLIVLAVLFPSSDSHKYSNQNNQKNTKEQLLSTTNPAYLVSPESFVIDEENIISNLPDDNKSVWVEEVVNENTIRVSYIIQKGGENIITFATVSLYGIKQTQSECFEREATKFLKKFIEHKYVYLSSMGADIPTFAKRHFPKKFLSRYVKIWKQDVDVQRVIKLYADKTGEDEIKVNVTLVRLGYAIPFQDEPFIIMDNSFNDALEVAKVAKEGFWGDICNEDE